MALTVYEVENGIFRGPRPHQSDYPELAKKFKTVVSLEGLEEDRDEADLLGKENPRARLVSFPISWLQIYVTGISTVDLLSIVWAVEGLERPLLVHCQHGQDRTGMVVAAYRMRHGYSFQEAWKEALRYGYRERINFGLNKTLREFAKVKGFTQVE